MLIHWEGTTLGKQGKRSSSIIVQLVAHLCLEDMSLISSAAQNDLFGYHSHMNNN